MISKKKFTTVNNNISSGNSEFANRLIEKHCGESTEIWQQSNLIHKEDKQSDSLENQGNHYTTILYNTLQQLKNTYNQEFHMMTI